MSHAKLRKAVNRLAEAATDAAWTQWSALLSLPSRDSAPRAIVDPEVLILASISFATKEARLWRLCAAWARTGTRLLSVQRMKNLTTHFDESVHDRLAEFAHIAVTKGSDVRWRKIAEPGNRAAPQREPGATPRLSSPPALMLRMRLGFGVGIKADVLTVLIGCAGGAMTIQQIASATHYYGRAVRRAAEELHAAGFLRVKATAPLSYSVDLRRWCDLLEIDSDDPPAWRPWLSIYSFVAAVMVWSKDLGTVSDVIVASEARDLLVQHPVALDAAGIDEMSPARYPGPAVIQPFCAMLTNFSEFIQSVV